MQNIKKIKIIATVIGFLFGLLFPFVTILILLNRYNLPFSLQAIGYLHTKEFSLYIVELEPFVLMTVAYILVDYGIKKREELSKKIDEINRTLERNSEFAKKIGQGELNVEFEPDKDDMLGRSLLIMRDNLIRTREREVKQAWIAKGKEIVGDILRYHNKIDQLSYQTLVAIVDYVNAIQGAFYLYDEDRELLVNIATYAYNRRKYLQNEFKIGQGLIGAAAYEKDIIYRKEIPDDYVTITSGILGDKKPKTLVITPLLGDEKLQGVIEIASLDSDMDQSVISLLKEISEIVGQTVFNLKVNERTEKLLQESREMTYKLRKNEDELRRNAEEMKKTQLQLEDTNRKLAAQIAEVERASKRLYALLENASEVISIYNNDGIIIYESPSITRILGYNPDELIGKNGFSIFDPKTNQILKNAFDKLLLEPSNPISFEYTITKPNGEEIWLESIGRNLIDNPAINGIIFNTRDITVRKIAEKAQRMSGQMQALSENSPDMIVRVSTEGKIYYANPIAEQFLGIGKSSLMGNTIFEINLNNEIKNFFISTLERIIENPTKFGTETTFPKSNDSEDRIVQFNAIPEFNEQAELETILYVAHDITETKKIQLEIEQKNKSITESINYARRIQTAILPTEAKMKQFLPSSFLFYLPRDVVSGDIPWIFKKADEIFFAAIDCTGHGVPGALLSMIAHFLLNNIVSTSGNELNAGEILNILHQSVRKTLKQDTPEAEARDGMDIALCKVNYKKNKLDFAGAHRPLYYLKHDGEFVQYKGTLKAIGGIPMQNRKEKEFENHTINFHKKDKIFIFSDGLADQIGGENNRKLKNSQIRNVLIENKDKSIEEFYTVIENTFFNWKGSNKQIDDILLIGVEL